VVVAAVVVSAAASRRSRHGAGSVDLTAEHGAAVAPHDPPHVHAAPPAALPGTLADASRVVSIEMYSAVWCSACTRAKAWMRDQGIAYHEVDVDQRAGALAQLQTLNPRRSLPTFDVDGQILVGFEETRLRSAIDQAARRSAHSAR
jgi:glutaredoxin 3